MAAPFSLTPGSLNTNTLDYRNTDNIKLYKAATQPLGDEKFDLQAAGLLHFIKQVGDRADEYGWSKKTTGILSIPLNPPTMHPQGPEQYLLSHYGTITMAEIEAADRIYLFTNSRAAQDNMMLYKMLMASITPEAHKTISLFESEYALINNPNTPTERKIKSGVMLLKVIIRESHIDTNATTSQLRTNLSELDQYMTSINSDIGVFNEYVRIQVQSLAARGQTTSDLLINLFKGYAVASDQEFRTYVARKQQDHDDNSNPTTAEQMMQLTKNLYDKLKMKNTWNSETVDEKLMVLQARMKTMQKDYKRKSHEQRNKASSNSGGGNQYKKKDGHQKPSYKSKSERDDPRSWPAPPDKSKTKTWRNKTYRYCDKSTGGKCNGKWVLHSAADCKGGDFLKRKYADTTEKKHDKSNDRHLRVKKALAATIQDSDSDSSGPN